MPDESQDWGHAHREDVRRFRTAVAFVALVLALPIIIWTDGLPQYFGVGLGSVAALRLFPESTPMISNIVDRLPFLASKGERR